MFGSQGEWLKDVALAKHTSWRVGGVSEHLFKPKDVEDLKLVLPQVSQDIAITWLGLGSNTLVRDGGNPGLTVLTQGTLNNLVLLDNNRVKAEAGVSCATMARFCARNDLAGGEFWAGIPGTMGGALRMNAGCFDGETWNHLETVETIDRTGSIRIRNKTDFDIAYRHINGLQKDEWFLSATFALPQGQKRHSLDTIKQLLARRAATQPTGEYNCGSVFRNPEGNFAAKLIEACHLKGTQLGGAYVSQKHANFITNDGSATAEDIENLIEHVAAVVLDKTGIQLHREVHVIGAKS